MREGSSVSPRRGGQRQKGARVREGQPSSAPSGAGGRWARNPRPSRGPAVPPKLQTIRETTTTTETTRPHPKDWVGNGLRFLSEDVGN